MYVHILFWESWTRPASPEIMKMIGFRVSPRDSLTFAVLRSSVIGFRGFACDASPLGAPAVALLSSEGDRTELPGTRNGCSRDPALVVFFASGTT